MMDKYKDALYELVNDENVKKDDIIFMKNDINSISKKILIIDKYISLTSNYLNKNQRFSSYRFFCFYIIYLNTFFIHLSIFSFILDK